MSEGLGPVWPSMEEWAAELRATDKPQTQGELCRGEARCCLGVLAEMAGGKPEPDGFGWLVFDDGTTTCQGCLREMPDWLGGLTHGAAAHANDDLGWSFAEIADWLEAGAQHNYGVPVMAEVEA